MARSSIIVAAVLVLVGAFIFTKSHAADEKVAKPKHAIKQVMGDAHKGGLLGTVLSGNASNEEKAKLLDYYVSMTENKPPKGEKASWESKTNALVLAAAKVVVGRSDGVASLKAATNCAACHKAHR
jgi:hypothetical protein